MLKVELTLRRERQLSALEVELAEEDSGMIRTNQVKSNLEELGMCGEGEDGGN